jgi:hypothetical protein
LGSPFGQTKAIEKLEANVQGERKNVRHPFATVIGNRREWAPVRLRAIVSGTMLSPLSPRGGIPLQMMDALVFQAEIASFTTSSGPRMEPGLQ